MSPKYKLDYFFDWGIDTALWGADTFTIEMFDVPVDLEMLPLTPETIQQIHSLVEWHGTALNWGDPREPGPWKQEECDRFNAAAKQLYETIVTELSADFEVINICDEMNVDPRSGF